MPRKAFKEDLSSAIAAPLCAAISRVEASEDDSFTFLYSNLNVKITAMVSDTSEYPSSHDYIVFADEDAAPAVAKVVQSVPNFHGKPIATFLTGLAKYLYAETATGKRDDPFEIDSDGDIDLPDAQLDHDDDTDLEEENEDWALDDHDAQDGSLHSTTKLGTSNAAGAAASASRARSDLTAAKMAGLKIAVLGPLNAGSSCYISVAIRVHKLGISEEAMQAWTLEPKNYLMLILYYPSGYRPLDVLGAQSAHVVRQTVIMAVAVSDTYKPRSVLEAQKMFNLKAREEDRNDEDSRDSPHTGLRQAFISRPLNALLNERLLEIIRARMTHGLGWAQAEEWFDQAQGGKRHANVYKNTQEQEIYLSLPSVVMADAIGNSTNEKALSFPLIAMQFLLRHFVRCTDFCLTCHCKVPQLEGAIKPYVCEKPLCLYQFMSLGFGPSIEHEILTQGFVVDILVSFAYSSAVALRLHSFPEGLGLTVPDVRLSIQGWKPPAAPPAAPRRGTPTAEAGIQLALPYQHSIIYSARLDRASNTLFFDPRNSTRAPFRVGDFIVVNAFQTPFEDALHYRVKTTAFFPSVDLSSDPLVYIAPGNVALDSVKGSTGAHAASATPPPVGIIEVTFQVYDQNFDHLDSTSRCQSLVLMLDLMPSVTEMKKYLRSYPGATLSAWSDRMSPAQVGILRWIVASNRSCIMQVDQCADDTARIKEERVHGMPDYLQFRFAMGDPQKTARFLTSIESVPGIKAIPTIFAWHGSDLANWHSIIRQGLHFDNINNGRAYGDGVYFARDAGTSCGYAGMRPVANSWPQSELAISSALALSEIVNAPDKFVSQTPYYVIKDLDWIQTRYLFVRPTKKVAIQEDVELSYFLYQDPVRTPTGLNGKGLQLPITAVTKSRRRVAKHVNGLVKAHDGAYEDGKSEMLDCDAASVMTDVEDLEILFEPVVPIQKTNEALPELPPLRGTPINEPILPFDRTQKTVPLLPPPPYATPIATKRLQKDFRALNRMQHEYEDAKALHDLGWWLDEDHITNTNNLYQWILELHSFPLSLPLAQDMKKKKMESIVFEIRFQATYPMSPPFIRVVRPRFLPFAAGGGGHVTAGGSICMDLLTNSGWSAANSLESVFMQIRMAIMSQDPRPARLLASTIKNAGEEYGVSEAIEAFKRVSRAHGWVIPEGLNAITY